jgi:hypothetical protein
MVNFLKDDAVWKEMFGVKKTEGKEQVVVVEPDYRSMQVDLNIGTTTTRPGEEDDRDMPKSGLKFHVVFMFTPPEPMRRPGTQTASNPAGTAVAGTR